MVKERRIGASSEYRTLYQSFWLRYRSHVFDINMTSISKFMITLYRDISEKRLWYRSPNASISKSNILYRVRYWLWHMDTPLKGLSLMCAPLPVRTQTIIPMTVALWMKMITVIMLIKTLQALLVTEMETMPPVDQWQSSCLASLTGWAALKTRCWKQLMTCSGDSANLNSLMDTDAILRWNLISYSISYLISTRYSTRYRIWSVPDIVPDIVPNVAHDIWCDVFDSKSSCLHWTEIC